MASVFPGMDPYIEGQEWEDFHHHFIEDLYNELGPQVRPRYVVRVEKRIYVEQLLSVPIPEEMREAFLTIRLRESMEVVTVIEVLSPANKRPGADGRREYLSKREAVLRSDTHLVEIDLLRGGERLPTNEPLPSGDYHAFVCRRQLRPQVEVYAWTLRQPLPRIPLPLLEDEPDAVVDLQRVFTTVYDRARYDYSLDYQRAPQPPLSAEDASWASRLLTDS